MAPCSYTGAKCRRWDNEAAEPDDMVVSGLGVAGGDMEAAHNGHGENRRSGIRIREMNSERRQIGGGRIGDADKTVLLCHDTMKPGMTWWDTECSSGSTHMRMRPTRYAAHSIGSRKEV